MRATGRLAAARPPAVSPRTWWRRAATVLAALALGCTTVGVAAMAQPSATAEAATALTCRYALPQSGPHANAICWIDWSQINLTQAYGNGQAVSLQLPGGAKVDFTIRLNGSSAAAARVYTWDDGAGGGSAFGRIAYYFTKPGVAHAGPNVALYQTKVPGGSTTIRLDGISATDSAGRPVTGYSFVSTDAEATNKNSYGAESIAWYSDKPMTAIPSMMGPLNGVAAQAACRGSFTGNGTTSVECVGGGMKDGYAGLPVLVSQGPSYMQTTLSAPNYNGREAGAFGVMVSSVQATKTVSSRYNPDDSFSVRVKDQNGTVLGSASTGQSGASADTGSIKALASTLSPGTYTFEEVGDGATDLNRYEKQWSCKNYFYPDGAATPTVTDVTPPGANGTSVSVSVAVGDDVRCNVTNTAGAQRDSVLVMKSATPIAPATSIQAGQEFLYTVTAVNLNAAPITGATVTDTLPAGVHAGSVDQDGQTTGDTVTWSNQSFGSYQSKIYTFRATADAAGSFTNVAQVTTPTGCEYNSGPCVGQVTTTIAEASGLSIAKRVVAGSTAKPGDWVTYELVVDNPGGQPTPSDQEVTDLIPAALTNVQTTPDPNVTLTGNSLTWRIPAGTTLAQIIQVRGQVAATQGAGPVENTARLSGGCAPGNCESSATFLVAGASPDIAITKTGPATAAIGSSVSYTISVRNNGDLATTQLHTVTDLLPDQLDFATARVSAAPYGSASVNTTTGEVTWALPAGMKPAAAVGPFSITVTATIKATASAGTMTNTASLPAGSQCSSRCTDTATTQLTGSTGALRLTKTASPSHDVRPGNPVTYTFVVTNAGTGALHNVQVTDPDTLFAADPVRCEGSGTDTIATLAEGEQVTCTMVHTFTGSELAAGGVAWATSGLTNTAFAAGLDVHDVPVAAPPATANVTFGLDVTPELTKQAAYTKPARAGDRVDYTITYAYRGDGDLTGVTMSDSMFPDIAEHCSPAIPSTVSPGFATTCTASHVVTEQDIVNHWDSGAIPNRVSVLGTSAIWPSTVSEAHRDAFVDIDTATPLVAFTGTKRASVSSADPGQTVRYTVTATNTGQLTATSVVVTDAFKGGAPKALDPASCTWPDPAKPGTLAPGATVSCAYPYPVQDADASSIIHNEASVAGKDPAGRSVGPTPIGEADVTVSSGTDLWAAKHHTSVLANTVKPGQSFGYSIEVHNDGQAAATGVRLSDKLPAGLNFVPADQADFTFDSATRLVTSKAPFDVPAAGSLTQSFTVQVDPAAAAPQTYLNIGAIDQMATPEQCATAFVRGCFKDDAAIVLDDSAISLSKSNSLEPGPFTVTRGQPFTYTITLFNSGATDATVSITDVLPDGLVFDGATQPGWVAPLTGRTARSQSVIVRGNDSTSLALKVKVADDAPAGVPLLNVMALDGAKTPEQCVANPVQAGCAKDPHPPFVPDHSGVRLAKSNSFDSDRPWVRPGDTYRYTITATNTGTETAQQVTISDTLPAGLQFDANQSEEWEITGSTATLRRKVDIGPGAANARSWELRVAVAQDAPAGYLRNVAVLDDQAPAECDPAHPVNSCAPDPNPPYVNTSILTKSAGLDSGAKVSRGQTITYTFVVDNISGVEPVDGYRIIDSIPRGASLAPNPQGPEWEIVAGSGTGGAGTIVRTATPFKVSAGGTATRTLSVKVADDAVAGSVIRNVGTFEGGRTPIEACVANPKLRDCVEDSSQPVVDDSLIEITKRNDLSDPYQVRKGERYSYEIQVTNLGSDASSRTVTVVEHLPAGLSFDGPRQDSIWTDVSARTATSVPLTLKGGESRTLHLNVIVNSDAVVGGRLVNVAVVDGSATPEECAADEHTTGCGVDPDPPTVVDHAAVEVTKTNDAPRPDAVKAGQTFTYTIAVHNTDKANAALDVHVTDWLPPGLAWATTGQSGVWTFEGATKAYLTTPITLAASEQRTFDLRVTVLPGASGTLRNVATLDDVDPATCDSTGRPWGCAVDDTIAVDNTAVTIAKRNDIDGNRVRPGQPFTYTFTLANTGSETATGVTVTDLLPAGLEVYPADQRPTWGAFDTTTRRLRSGPVDVPAGGAPVLVALRVRVAPDATPLSSLVNAGSIDGTTPVADCLATPLAAGCAVDPKPLLVDDSALTISKTNDLDRDPSVVMAGESFTYTLRVTNLGQSDAIDQIITDRLPDGLEFDGTQASPWGTPTGTTISTAAITIPGGSSVPLSLKVKVAQEAKVGERLTNVAAVTSMSSIDQCLADLTTKRPGCAWDTVAPTVVDHSAVVVTKANPLQGQPPLVKRGQTFTYTITATNRDKTVPARGVTVTDWLPKGLSFALPLDARWKAPVGRSITSHAFDIAAGGFVSIPLTVKVDDDAAGVLRNVAIKDQDPVPDCAANPAADGCDPNPPHVDTVTLTKRADVARVKPGDTITYTFTATNTGDEPVPHYQIIDSVPAGARLDPLTQNGWNAPTGAGGPGTIVTSVPLSIDPGRPATWRLTMTVDDDAPAGRQIVNVATMAGGRTPIADCVADPTKADCVSDTTRPVVDDAEVAITKSNNLAKPATGPATVMAGEDFVYYVTLTNAGQTPATGVVVTDRLPAGLAFAADQDSQWRTPTGQEIRSLPQTVTKGTPIRLPLRVTVLNTAKAGQLLTNIAAIDTVASLNECAEDSTRTRAGCAWDDNAPRVTDHSAVRVTKANDLTGTPPIVTVGQRFTYTITATNTDSSIDARGVTVSDTLPAGLTFVYPLDAAQWTMPVGQTITSKPFPVPAGRSVLRSFLVEVAPGASGTLRNVAVKDTDPKPDCAATPTADGCDPNPPVVNTVVPAKTSDAGPRVKPGQLVTFTLTATNTGQADYANYGLIDQVPVGMSLDPLDQLAGGWRLIAGTGEAGSIVRSDPLFGVKAGEQVRRTLTMRVDANARDGQVIRNVGAVVGGRTPIADCVADPTRPDCYQEETQHVVDDSVIQLAKDNDVTQSHRMVTVGQSFSYLVTATNTGSSDATGVVLTDQLPPGIAFDGSLQDSAWVQPAATDRTIRSKPMTIAGGTSIRLPIKVKVAPGASGTLTNVVALNGTATPQECIDDPSRTRKGCAWDSHPVRVDNTSVTATKSPSIGVNEQVKPGQRYSYTFTAANKGTEPAAAVRITDQLPAGLLLDSASAQPDFTVPAIAGVVTSKPFDLAPNGTKSLTLYVRVDPAARAGTIIKNLGTITKPADDGPSLPDCVRDPGSSPACVKEPGEHEVNDSAISITKLNTLSEPRQVLAGEEFQYLIDVANTGESLADGVVITDQLPAGLAFAAKQSTSDWVSMSGVTAVSRPLRLAGKTHYTLSVDVTVTASAVVGDTLTNVAAVGGMASPEQCWTERLAGRSLAGCAFDETAPKVVDHAKVVIAKTNSLPVPATGSQPRVQRGDRYTYWVKATNTDTTIARAVRISDTLPAGLALDPTAGVRQDARWTITNGARTLTYLTDLRAGEVVSLPIHVIVTQDATGTLRNAAVLDGASEPPCATSPATPGCDEQPPYVDTVTPSKTSNVGDGARVRPGQKVTYTIQATNTGTVDVANYGFIDQVPAGMTLDRAALAADGWRIMSGTGTAGTIVQSDPLFTVKAGLSVSRVLTMVVAADAKNGVVIRNVGTVVGGKTPIAECVANPTKPDCYQEPTDHAVDDSDLTLAKTNNVTQSRKLVRVGERFTYTIVVSNSGASTARDVSITDRLPLGLVFDGEQDSNVWQAPTDPRTIRSVPLEVPGRSSKKLTLVVRVAPGATGQLVNVSAVDGKVTPEQCAANWTLPGCGVDTTPVTVDNTAISATKRASVGDGAPVKPGQTYFYTITARNSGTEAATQVTVRDKLPTGLAWARSADFPNPPQAGVVTSVPFDLAAAGGTRTLRLNVTVAVGAVPGSVIENIGSITKPSDDGPTIDQCVANPLLPQCFEEPGGHLVDDSDITVVKTHSLPGTPPLVSSGQVYTYDLVVTNSGNSADPRVVVSDQLPAGLTFSPTLQSGWTIDAAGRRATSIPFGLDGKSQVTLHLSVRVADGLASGTVLKNVSAVRGTTSGGTDVSDCIADETKPGCGPDKNPPMVLDHSKVTVTKVNDLPGATPVVRVGDSFSYTVTATNTGSLPVRNVRVSDSLPAGLGLAGLPAGWQIAADGALFFDTDLAAGASVSKRISVTVLAGASGTLRNVVVKDDGPPAACDRTPSPAECDPRPPTVDNTKVTIAKSSGLGAGARVKPGQEFSYTFTVRNDGTEAAKGVGVTDTLPAGLDFAATAQPGWRITGRTATASPTFDLPPNGGIKTLTLHVKVAAGSQPGLVIVNTGCIVNLHTNVCADDSQPPTFDDSAIQLTKTNDTGPRGRSVQVGETFTYTITATNTGHTTAEQVVLRDTLPLGLEFAPATQTGWASLSGRDARSIALRIEGGGHVALTLAVRVTPAAAVGAVLKNYVAVDGEATPGECATNPALPGCGEDNDPPKVVDHADITLAKSNDVPVTTLADGSRSKIVRPGDSFTYTITVTNTGTTPARAIKVSDTVPAGLAVTAADGWTASGATLTRVIDSLAAGRSVSFSIKVLVGANVSGVVRNVAVLDDTDPDTCVGNPSAPGCGVDPEPPTAVNVKLTKSNSLNGAGSVKPGQPFAYTITATNAGTGPASNIVIVDRLPAGLEFASPSQPGWTFKGDTAISTRFELAAGASRSVTLAVRVTASAAAGTLIRNAAAVSGVTDAEACLTTPTLTGCGVDPNPPLVDRDVMQIEKHNDLPNGTALVNRGQPFGYNLTVHNLGYIDVAAVTLTDRLPDGVAFAGASQPGWATLNGRTGTSEAFSVPAGGVTTLHVATVATKTSAGLLRNVVALSSWHMAGQDNTATRASGASVAAPTAGGRTIEQCMSDPTQPGCAFDDIVGTSERIGLRFTKSNDVTGGVVTVGTRYAYTITVTNATAAASTGITVTDTLPAGLAFEPASQAGWRIAGSTATSAAFDLGAGQSVSLRLSVVVTPGAAGSIRNVAVMDERDPADCATDPGLVGCAVDPDPPFVDAGPATLTLKKVGASTDVNANGVMDRGDQVLYSFHVTNTGAVATGSGLSIDDPMLEAAGLSIICPASPLAPGESVTCRAAAPYVIGWGDEQAGQVRNTAAAVIGEAVSRPASFVVSTSRSTPCQTAGTGLAATCPPAGYLPTTGGQPTTGYQPAAGYLPTTGASGGALANTGAGVAGAAAGAAMLVAAGLGVLLAKRRRRNER